MQQGLTLVFPAGLPDAQRFRAQAQAAGQRLIGASSLRFDPAARDYEHWAQLPYVHEDGFAGALGTLLTGRGISAIYAPHGVVSLVLADLLPRLAPGVRLLAADPMVTAQRDYRRLLARAAAAGTRAWFDGAAPPLSVAERAGLLRLVETIPGMTDGDKADALIEVMRTVPAADVIEVGSWWGRSAALLLLLARRYGAGPVLCIDPWRDACLHQGVPALDQASARIDAAEGLAIFTINLQPLARGDLNVIRATSAEAAASYAPGLSVTTQAFGTTRYSGRIGLLHIDGNHTFQAAAEDARLWTPHVCPGGWVVFDDYVWAFGDGPRRAGDAFLAANNGRIAASFVMGTALFVRMAA